MDRPYPIRHNSSFSVCISAAVVANAYCIFPSFPSYKSETCVKTIKYSQWTRPAQLSFLRPFRSQRKISMAYMRRYSKSWLRYSVHEGPVHMLLYHTACSAYIWRFHQGALPFNAIWRPFGTLMFQRGEGESCMGLFCWLWSNVKLQGERQSGPWICLYVNYITLIAGFTKFIKIVYHTVKKG